jgi:hypothetical protein
MAKAGSVKGVSPPLNSPEQPAQSVNTKLVVIHFETDPKVGSDTTRHTTAEGDQKPERVRCDESRATG